MCLWKVDNKAYKGRRIGYKVLEEINGKYYTGLYNVHKECVSKYWHRAKDEIEIVTDSGQTYKTGYHICLTKRAAETILKNEQCNDSFYGSRNADRKLIIQKVEFDGIKAHGIVRWRWTSRIRCHYRTVVANKIRLAA